MVITNDRLSGHSQWVGPHNGDAVETKTTDGRGTADLPSGCVGIVTESISNARYTTRTSPRLGVTTRMESTVVEVVDERGILEGGVAESSMSSTL